jgi:hypothetical protein
LVSVSPAIVDYGGIEVAMMGCGYSSDRVDEFAFYELKTEISVFDLDLLVQTFIPQSFLFED